MAGAYSAFGNNGTYNEPHFVKSIEFNDGTKLDLTPKSKSAMSDYTAFMITDMLKTAVKTGTGQLAQVPGVEVAGKTGTTNFDDNEVKGTISLAVAPEILGSLATHRNIQLPSGREWEKTRLERNHFQLKSKVAKRIRPAHRRCR